MDAVKKIIFEMLSTSTGKAMGDSGDAYGCNREKNQGKTMEDRENEPSVTFSNDTREWDGEKHFQYDYTISVYHYLTGGALDLDDLCDEYNDMPCKDWDGPAYGISETQGEWLEENGFELFKDSFNTYNRESFLSQILQGTYAERGNDRYVLLQIHQGCDARGGYTDAKLFLLPEEWMPSEDVYGTFDGRRVSNIYDGVRLRYDEEDMDDIEKEIKGDENTVGKLYLSDY